MAYYGKIKMQFNTIEDAEKIADEALKFNLMINKKNAVKFAEDWFDRLDTITRFKNQVYQWAQEGEIEIII